MQKLPESKRKFKRDSKKISFYPNYRNTQNKLLQEDEVQYIVQNQSEMIFISL